MRRRARCWLALATALGAVALTAGTSGATPSPRHPTGSAPGDTVAVTALTQVEMSSFGRGLGVADLASRGIEAVGPEVVVTTDDGGSSWQVLGDYAQRRGHVYTEPRLLVAPDGDLYAVDLVDGWVWLSTDRAASWARLRVDGELDGARLVGDGLWVTADRCGVPRAPTRTTTCTTYLSVYELGSLAPLLVHAVPGAVSTGVAAPTRQSAKDRSASVLGVVGRQGAVVVEGAAVGSSRLLVTADAGAAWRRVDDPCAHLLPGSDGRYAYPFGLYASPVGRWTLYCTLDEGMNQGVNVLYTSTDAGRGWRVLSRSSGPGIKAVGSLDDLMAAAFAMSNDGRCFWKISTVGPETQSCDGGLRWGPAPRPADSELPSAIDPIGPRGAFVVDVSQGLWRTVDGVHWTLVR